MFPLFAPPAFADWLLVGNKSDDTVQMITLPAGRVHATLPTGAGPHEIAVSPDGRLAVVTNYGRGAAPGRTLTVIDVLAARVAATIDLGEYRRPHGIEWLPDGRHVVLTAEDNRALLVVDVTERSVVGAIETGQDVSHMLALTPDAARAFIANIGSGSVSVIDLARRVLLATVPTGAGAEGVAVTPDGREVWVTNRAANTVTILDAHTMHPLAAVAACDFPIRVRFMPQGGQALVTCARSDELVVYDRATRAIAHRIPLALGAEVAQGRLLTFGRSSVPIGVLVAPDGARVYVAHANGDVVSIIDTNSWERVGLIRTGREPDALGYSTAGP
ncbi:MAG TPA: YncE family protein [Gammaproteobacteria bacterium]|nr:YncE family protein [Gammaproteobacteria bacterium]